MTNLDFFADEYNQDNWSEYAQCFKQVDVSIEGVSQDIVNAVCTILGMESGIEWLKTPFSLFEGKSAIELVKTKKGCKAIKAFIMRLPN